MKVEDEARKPNKASAYIGRQIRLRRQVRGMSLKDVASRAQLSIGLISQVERGLTAPSVQSMMAICEALEMPVRWLFDTPANPDAEENEIVVRHSKRRKLYYENGTFLKEIMTPDSQREIQMLRFVMQPGASSGEPYHNSEGNKCGLVLNGLFGLEIDKRQFQIGAGDSFAFPASADIRYWTVGDEPCEVIWIASPATV
ncbi:cupin domain-containing protein (plasmid) [Brucella anthropi]|uniref:cupin domain-containing protein n=1 Tax=Brucella anthropi TaxID=529 RepID=UPI00188C077A|nr:cupin domain-containing protein [Brucella anthropi]QPA29858.1 cupin domain-containing protein [Brucella anthropi]